MSIERKVKRGAIGRKYGTGAIQSLWRGMQLKKYGKDRLETVRVACSPKNRLSKFA